MKNNQNLKKKKKLGENYIYFIIKHLKQPKCSTKEKWLSKFCHIYLMKYYATIKNNVKTTAT